MLPSLTIKIIKREAAAFALQETAHHEPTLFGVTDGKRVGTYFEHKFRAYVSGRYSFQEGSSARGIDWPSLAVDMKVTSIKQPQSSCPFKSARQKIYGLGYSLLVFVYEKTDDPKTRTGNLKILHTIFVRAAQTGDYQMTRGIREMLEREANKDDLVALMTDRNLPIDEIQANALADEILEKPPKQGYLTISNALQWRLQYGRAITVAGDIAGVQRLGHG